MDLWTREARLFKYGSGTGTNFSALRGENEKLSGGGKSSGLMSFLKIGDRAAGAIKSGGTTRRAAKMVVVDVDHPDIEEYINWKVKEEQKVAALVTGSKICQKRLQAVMKACVNCDDAEGVSADAGTPNDRCFDPAKNPALKRAIKEARRDEVPNNYILRAALISRFSAGFFSGRKQSSPSPSQLMQAFITALRCFWLIFEPVTRLATFCSSITFQLM